jgi:acyl-CoA reductase-like NAD-dependent aldehyde dehydrogenase
MAEPSSLIANGAGNRKSSFGLVIDGADISTSEDFHVFDPITKSIVHSAPSATEKQAIHAVESAEAAFETWRDSTPLERRTILNKAVEILESRKDELVNAMVSETGAKPSWAAFNIKTGIQFVMEGAGMATQVKGELLQSNDKGIYVRARDETVLTSQELWRWSSRSLAALYWGLHHGTLQL